MPNNLSKELLEVFSSNEISARQKSSLVFVLLTLFGLACGSSGLATRPDTEVDEEDPQAKLAQILQDAIANRPYSTMCPGPQFKAIIADEHGSDWRPAYSGDLEGGYCHLNQADKIVMTSSCDDVSPTKLLRRINVPTDIFKSTEVENHLLSSPIDVISVEESSTTINPCPEENVVVGPGTNDNSFEPDFENPINQLFYDGSEQMDSDIGPEDHILLKSGRSDYPYKLIRNTYAINTTGAQVALYSGDQIYFFRNISNQWVNDDGSFNISSREQPFVMRIYLPGYTIDSEGNVTEVESDK